MLKTQICVIHLAQL